MKQPNSNSIEELLAGYLDGELDAQQRAHVEAALAQQPALAETLERWRQMGQSIRELPRKQLPTDFSDRVLQQIAATTDSDAAGQVELSPPADSGFLKAATLIAVLAAMLLMAVMVVQNRLPTNQDPAADQISDSGNPPNGATDASADSNHRAATDENTAQPTPRKLERPALASRLKPSPTDSEGTDLPETPIEQVLIIQFQEDADGEVPSREASQRLVTNMFINNGIRLVSSSSNPELEKQFAASEPAQTEAVYVVASINQLTAAITEIKGSANIRVHAISLKIDGESSPQDPPAAPDQANESTARIVRTYPLDAAEKPTAGADDRDPEVESIDRWFGLTHTIEPARKMRLLVLVQLGE